MGSYIITTDPETGTKVRLYDDGRVAPYSGYTGEPMTRDQLRVFARTGMTPAEQDKRVQELRLEREKAMHDAELEDVDFRGRGVTMVGRSGGGSGMGRSAFNEILVRDAIQKAHPLALERPPEDRIYQDVPTEKALYDQDVKGKQYGFIEVTDPTTGEKKSKYFDEVVNPKYTEWEERTRADREAAAKMELEGLWGRRNSPTEDPNRKFTSISASLMEAAGADLKSLEDAAAKAKTPEEKDAANRALASRINSLSRSGQTYHNAGFEIDPWILARYNSPEGATVKQLVRGLMDGTISDIKQHTISSAFKDIGVQEPKQAAKPAAKRGWLSRLFGGDTEPAPTNPRNPIPGDPTIDPWANTVESEGKTLVAEEGEDLDDPDVVMRKLIADGYSPEQARAAIQNAMSNRGR